MALHVLTATTRRAQLAAARSRLVAMQRQRREVISARRRRAVTGKSHRARFAEHRSTLALVVGPVARCERRHEIERASAIDADATTSAGGIARDRCRCNDPHGGRALSNNAVERCYQASITDRAESAITPLSRFSRPGRERGGGGALRAMTGLKNRARCRMGRPPIHRPVLCGAAVWWLWTPPFTGYGLA